MEIWHRVAFNGDTKPDFMMSVDNLAIKYKISPIPGQKIGLIYFDIAESDPHWLEMEDLIQKFGASNIYDTVFTDEEILEAKWGRLMSVFEQGYPQPEATWATNPITYEGVCSKCGTYQRQRESFRIKKEPRLGKNHFMSLFWTDALFTISTILTEFAAHQLQGYEVWPVLIHKTGQPSQIVSQVYVSNITKATLIPEADLPQQTCPECGITKYQYHKRGYMQFSRDLLESDLDFMLTREWFGDRHMAFREILVSNRVARLIIDNKWRGARLKPVQPIS